MAEVHEQESVTEFDLTMAEIKDVIKSRSNMLHLMRMSGYYLPPEKMCTMIFLKKVLTG